MPSLCIQTYRSSMLVPPADNLWHAPPEGAAKLNRDASFLKETGRTWGGVVARDYRGVPFLSVGCQLHQCMLTEEAEASAVLMGLFELLKYFRGHLIVEVDCVVIGRELQYKGVSRSPWFGVLSDIKTQLEAFASVEVSIVRRSQNKLAHEIAATARSSQDHFRLADVHASVRQIMLADCNTTNA